MSPHLRRVIHDAVDQILDAIADETKTPIRKTRTRPKGTAPDLSKSTPETNAKAAKALKRAGLA